jgi:hypothetical protein
LPQLSTDTSKVVLLAPDGRNDTAAKAPVGDAPDQLADVDHMVGVSDLYAGGGESISADGRTGFARVAHDVNRLEDADYDAAMAALEPAAAAGVRVEVDGLLGAAEPRTEASDSRRGQKGCRAVALTRLSQMRQNRSAHGGPGRNDIRRQQAADLQTCLRSSII